MAAPVQRLRLGVSILHISLKEKNLTTQPASDDKFAGKWFWCERCDCPAIQCYHCKHTSCNGNGCNHCHDDFDEVNELINKGLAPSKEGLPVRNRKKDLDDLFNSVLEKKK